MHLHVFRPPRRTGAPASAIALPSFRRIVVGIEDREGSPDALALGRLAARIAGSDLTVVPAKDLPGLAVAGAADVAVLDSPHGGSFGRVFPGALSERLLSGARCCVAIAPRGFADQYAQRLRRIGCAFDGSAESWRALLAAEQIARSGGGTVQLVGVGDHVNNALEEAHAELPAGLAASPLLLNGDPATALATQSEQLDALIMGSRGHGPLGAVLAGSVSARLIRSAACPLLVVPRPPALLRLDHGVVER